MEWVSRELPKGQYLLSLLSQYTPFYHSCDHPDINRRITSYEYQKVVDAALSLGLTEGFIQEKSSAKEEYTQIIKDVYSINSFVKLCGMELVDVECGKVTLAMPIDAAKHTNLYEVAHGGSLAALADTALGMASASVGARVVTINYTINFIKTSMPEMWLLLLAQ